MFLAEIMSKSSCFLCHKTWAKCNVKMYHAPKSELKRNKWAESCGVQLTPWAKICCHHFSPEDFLSGPDQKRVKLAENAVPMKVEIVSDFTAPQTIPKFVDASTHTQFDSGNNTAVLQAEIAALKAEVEELRHLQTNLKAILTEGQLRKLLNPGKIFHWSWKDMSSAISLHAAGPRAYNHLIRKGFPLPCQSTVAKWCQKLKFDDGVLKFSLSVMRSANDMSVADKLCILSFDEMGVDQAFEYDSLTDAVRHPSKYVQVIIARGLRYSWKQPVFFAYDCKMTKAIICNVIVQLYEAGFPVVGVVSDMGAGNQALWRELNVSSEQTWFQNPANEGKVFVFADVPHLLKLIRNHYLDDGLVFRNVLLTSRSIADLLRYTRSSDVSICHKISDRHLTVHHAKRQKVKLAAQLLSHNTASALRHCFATGYDVYMGCETADYFEVINNWFDLLNVKFSSFQSFPSKKPFGMCLPEQLEILSKMDSYMLETRAFGRNTLLPFQKGVLLTNQSLRDLYQYVHEKYDMQYILTYRLNQDILESFFGVMRRIGGPYNNPTPMQFKYRLRKYLLARNAEALSAHGNVEADETEWLQFDSIDSQSSFLVEHEAEVDEGCAVELATRNIEPLHEDGLEYVAGFIIRKLGLSEHVSQESSHTWVDEISRGALLKPSTEFLNKIKELEQIFYSLNGELVSTGPSFLKTLLKISEKSSLSSEVKSLFFRSRMYMRIKSLNKALKH